VSEVTTVAPLDELMLAMDVVDTLRHRQRVLERELAAGDRDEKLVNRLREIYAGQGIEVSDDILARGVAALREDRFVYVAPEPGFERTLATIYVTRWQWGKLLGGIVGLIAAALLGYQLLVSGPAARELAALPTELSAVYASIESVSRDDAALEDAARLRALGESAMERNDMAAARAAVDDLESILEQLTLEYELRIVSRAGELSGVWRVPDVNEEANNYYLIVEAITPQGERLTLPILNEEDGRTYRVDRWGIRVDEATFQSVAADKQDDGIIQQAVVGTKSPGLLEPIYRLPTSGAAITRW
jgi:hypothetical protein